MRIQAAVTMATGVLLVSACGGKPVPADKAMYVGEWQGPNMYLLLQPQGRVVYQRVDGTKRKRVEGPLQRFEGDEFTVGMWLMGTTFKVSTEPHEVDGTLRMTVDGVELIRIGDGSAPTPPNST